MLALASLVDHFHPTHFRENLDRSDSLLSLHFHPWPFRLLIPCSFRPFPLIHRLKHLVDPLPPFWPTLNQNHLPLFVGKMGQLWKLYLKHHWQKPLLNRPRQTQLPVHCELPLLALVVL